MVGKVAGAVNIHVDDVLFDTQCAMRVLVQPYGRILLQIFASRSIKKKKYDRTCRHRRPPPSYVPL